MEKTFLTRVCDVLELGTVKAEPQRLTGGFLHQMYSVFTDKGKYAVKLLNPFIMQRETAKENFRTAEHFEAILEERGLPILPALRFCGQKMQEMEGQYYYVFDWFDGKALQPKEITAVHAGRMGQVLARIHGAETGHSDDTQDKLCIDWADYTARLLEAEPELGEFLKANLPFLEEQQKAANMAMQKLPAVRTICHNDMDPKNVLWCGTECRVIDLECLGYDSPYLELLETALCWAGLDDCRIDSGLFCAFIKAYRDAGGTLPTDWSVLFDANCGRLGWLEYCAQRALGINCSEEEQKMGREAVGITLRQLLHTEEMKPLLLRRLEEL